MFDDKTNYILSIVYAATEPVTLIPFKEKLFHKKLFFLITNICTNNLNSNTDTKNIYANSSHISNFHVPINFNKHCQQTFQA